MMPKKEFFSSEKIQEALDWCYDKAVSGVGALSGSDKIAADYLEKYINPKLAAKQMVRSQIAKCTTSGFVTSLGGILTLPITIPANITTVWYVQLQMIAAIARMGGYDPKHDEVQAMAYACLTGSGIVDVLKQSGVKFVNQGAKVLIQKLPYEAVKAINKKVGMRFLTKFGEKGIINLGKMIPVAGGIVGGGIDFASTKIIADRAIKLFIDDLIV